MEKTTHDKKKIICITNRHLCEGSFLERIRRIAAAGAECRKISERSGAARADAEACRNTAVNTCAPELWGIVLREKDLPEHEYAALADEAQKIADEYGVRLIRHFYPASDPRKSSRCLHLPLWRLDELIGSGEIDPAYYEVLGASCHSADDARLAESLGCTYITFGHVFETDCKKGLEPRGLSMLEGVVRSVSIPVFAIGGISPENYALTLDRGAAGACAMSGFMKCPDPLEYLLSFK